MANPAATNPGRLHPLFRQILEPYAPKCCDRFDRCTDCPAPPRSFGDFRDTPRSPSTDGDLTTWGSPLKVGR